MNICTCVLYHEVLVYGVCQIRNRHDRVAHTSARVAGRCVMHPRTRIRRAFLLACDREPLEIRVRSLFSAWFSWIGISRGGSVLLSKGRNYLRTVLIVKFDSQRETSGMASSSSLAATSRVLRYPAISHWIDASSVRIYGIISRVPARYSRYRHTIIARYSHANPLVYSLYVHIHTYIHTPDARSE